MRHTFDSNRRAAPARKVHRPKVAPPQLTHAHELVGRYPRHRRRELRGARLRCCVHTCGGDYPDAAIFREKARCVFIYDDCPSTWPMCLCTSRKMPTTCMQDGERGGLNSYKCSMYLWMILQPHISIPILTTPHSPSHPHPHTHPHTRAHTCVPCPHPAA